MVSGEGSPVSVLARNTETSTCCLVPTAEPLCLPSAQKAPLDLTLTSYSLVRHPKLFCCFLIPWASGRTMKGHLSPPTWTHLDPLINLLSLGSCHLSWFRKGTWAQMPSVLESCTSIWGCLFFFPHQVLPGEQQGHETLLRNHHNYVGSHTPPPQHEDFSSLGAENLVLVHYIYAILDVSYVLSFEIEKPRL